MTAAVDVSHDLRRWLRTLDDSDLGVVLAMSAPLRAAANVAQGVRAPVRRELLAARAWLTRVQANQIPPVALCVLHEAVAILIGRMSFSGSAVSEPTREQLSRMLVALGRPFGTLALYGLLLGDTPATPLAVEHRAELENALLGAERKSLTELLGTGDDDVTDLAGGDTEEADGPLAGLDRQLAELRTLADVLAESLRGMADVVRRGAEAGSLAPLDEYVALRADLMRDLKLDGAVAFDEAAARLAELHREEVERQRAEVERLRAEEAERQQAEIERQHTEAAAARAAGLLRQIGDLENLLGTLPQEARPGMMASLAVLQGQYAALVSTEDSAAPAAVEQVALPREEPRSHQPDPAPGDVELASRPGEQETLDRQEPPAARQDAGQVTEAPDVVAASVEDLSQDEIVHGLPWEEGDPPLAVELTTAGRLAEAYWSTAMSYEPDGRASALRFATAAYAVANNAEATAVLAALDLDTHELSEDHDAAVLVTTAMLRAGLVAGWGHALLAQLRPVLALPAPWESLVDACISAVRREFHVDFEVGLVPPVEDVHEVRAELGRRAALLLEELPKRKTSYPRATRVLQRLTTQGQPLANALNAVVAWSAAATNALSLPDAVAEVGPAEAVDELIEKADAAMRSPRQARMPIISAALRTLQRSIEEARAVVQEADAVNRRLTASESDDGSIGTRLLRTAGEAAAAEVPPGMVGAALSLLHRWLCLTTTPVWTGFGAGRSPLVNGVPGIAEPNADVLLPLPDLPRDADGRPDPEDPRTSAMLARIVAKPDVVAAVRTYCDTGDLRSATRLIDLAETGYWPGVTGVSALREKVTTARETHRRRHRQALAKARDLFARVRTQNLLDQEVETAVSGRLVALASVREDRYDEAAHQVRSLTDDLEAKQRARVEELRTELATLPLADPDRTRIGALLDDDDTVTATEFLAFVREGKPLPEHAEVSGQDLREFTAALADGVARGLGNPQTGASHWAQLIAQGREPAALGAVGLRAWDSLNDVRQHGGDKLPGAVKDILRVLGLNLNSGPREYQQRQRRGFRKFRVRGSTTDGSYVSLLGSAATEYHVTLVVEERRGQSVLDLLDEEEAGRANVVLYLHPLDLAARRQLAARSVGSEAQALVVDPAVFGWVAATAPGSWRATQRVTLPWTALSPYTPFVAGLVPPEVFVGRTSEMTQVTDPNGGLFIYGGRQLGKSALLRRVEATFNAGEDRHAVYLDLKGKGIGEAEPASRIWRELVGKLKERGVLAAKVPDDASADEVVELVRKWLNNTPGRRLLLLADEADAFLTADSRGVPGVGGVAIFPNVLRLKELMESTNRRFKVVFAGLHQVQRFGRLSNVPLVHGGPDVLVGPLNAVDARRLVTEPLAALGYTFEQPELVWRLLAATNYQAGLIQIFCEELVGTLHIRVSQCRELPVRIRESDVEAVAASDRVRARIEERLRITINLEDRYRVLMLIIALESLNDSFSADYSVGDLLGRAQQAWPDGFGEMTHKTAEIHLDEMVGLGLLIKLSGQPRYAVRSPNVVNMLGTKANLKRELEQTDFDLPYEYNPRDARRLLLVDELNIERRSPLTDGQLSEQTDQSAGVTVVVGSPALGADRVFEAVRDYATARSLNVRLGKSAADVTREITAATRRRRRTIVVADLRGKPAAEGADAVQALVDAELTAVVLADREHARELVGVARTEPVRLTRWTATSLRSWPECPFDALDARTSLIDATGGWPEQVEDLIGAVMRRGRTQAQATGAMRTSSGDPGWAAKFLDQTGVDAGLRGRIGGWADYFDPGDTNSPVDIAAALDLDLPAATVLLEELAELGVLDEDESGVSLDRVVHRCLTTLRQQS